MRINIKEKRGRQEKKAVSEVLATILIVLFVIAALVIVSVVLFQFIRSKSEEITAGCVSIDIAITKAEYNQTGNVTMVYVKRAGGDADMAGMKFVFDGKEKTPSLESDNASLKILETGRYIFNNIASKPKRIEVAPIVKTEAEKEMNCGVKAIISERDIAEKSISVSAPAPLSQQFQDIRNGLVAEWKFDENPQTHLGIALDSSGNGNNGIVYANDGTANKAVSGRINSALSFDGNDDYIKFSAANMPTGERTITLWFYTSDTSATRQLFGYGGNTNVPLYSSFIVYLSADKKNIIVHRHYPGGEVFNYALNSPMTNSWHYLMFTSNSAGSNLYLDGQLLTSNNVVISTYVSGKDGFIGSMPAGSGIGTYIDSNYPYWNGKIDEVRVYNRALSATEIQQLYQFYQQS